MRARNTTFEILHFSLELFDCCVTLLKVLVETITLRDEPLLPLPEALFLDLDLLGKSLPQRLFLFLEFGIIQLPWTGLSNLSGFHLLCTVRLVVNLLGGMDEIQHVRADQDGSKLLEVAVVFILDFGNAPRVLTSLAGATITSLDILFGTNYGEWHRCNQTVGVLQAGLIILLQWRLVDLDALRINN